MRPGTAAITAGALICLALAPTAAQARWERLGCQKVGFIADKDVIRVGRGEGRFKSIRLQVSGNKVYMDDLKVIYANGEPDDIPVRSEIRAGGQTRPLDLRGERRAIKEIEMKYRSQPNFKGQATVCVEAQS
ncbi:MAG TPA: hypothetical protein VFR19_03360 [Hyphomicrobiaceae bacterium]|jgi:hypothetical protein|nr:hypothetical protein [Hyphomicrobiaceae bacterium]